MATVVVKGHRNCSITIEANGYENAAATEGSDANWVSCQVSVTVGAFRGSTAAAIDAADFKSFLGELERLLALESRGAKLTTDEDAIHLEIAVAATGVATIQGTLSELGSPRAELTFAFESDLDSLASTARQLLEVTRIYPKRSSDL